MDYHLEPARYESMTFTKLLARYELVLNCDWVGNMQRSLDADACTGDKMSIEGMRAGLCVAFYASAADGSGGFDSRHASNDASEGLNIQWKNLVDTILRLTAWDQQTNDGSLQTRVVDQSKVNKELAYKADVAKAGDAAGITVGATVNVAGTGAGVGDPAVQRKIVGMSCGAQASYDPESLGQLINNSNMSEILIKMRNHGCFIEDDDKTANTGDEGVNGAGDPTANKYVVNPRVQENTAAADGTQSTMTLLDKEDEIIFPVNLLSIVGHTATSANEDFDNGASLEINITFKQNKALDSALGHVDVAATTETA
jgi:hypothetical protein